MKKRIFLCVLLVTMCLFDSKMPVLLFGDSSVDDPLAQIVFKKYSATLLRADVQAVLPEVLVAMKADDIPLLFTRQVLHNRKSPRPETRAKVINLFFSEPDHLRSMVPKIADEFLTLLQEDAEVKAILSDEDFQRLLLNPNQIAELVRLMRKVFVITKRFTVIKPGIGFHKAVDWSEQVEFPGPVIEAGARSTTPLQGYGGWVDQPSWKGNIVILSGSVRMNLRLEVEVTAEYLSKLPQDASDVNNDGIVNILDLVFIASRFGSSDEPEADLNGDGLVNILDLVLVASALNDAAAAPFVHAESLKTLSASEVQRWLTEARQLAPTDAPSQRGIAVLQHLLATLSPPKKTILLPNYPNPFNPETWIPYHLAEPADVTLHIYSADGRLVRTLALGHQAAGIYESKSRAASWDGRNSIGERVASGLYFYTLTAGDFADTGKMLIMK